MQKKFDDFRSDLTANEVRLAEMNEIAMNLMSLGQTEAALKIQTQIEDLNTKWNSLQQMAQVGFPKKNFAARCKIYFLFVMGAFKRRNSIINITLFNSCSV